MPNNEYEQHPELVFTRLDYVLQSVHELRDKQLDMPNLIAGRERALEQRCRTIEDRVLILERIVGLLEGVIRGQR